MPTFGQQHTLRLWVNLDVSRFAVSFSLLLYFQSATVLESGISLDIAKVTVAFPFHEG